MIHDVWKCLNKTEKVKLFILLIGMFLASLCEAISIGIAVPYVGLLVDPESTVSKIKKYELIGNNITFESDIFLIFSTVFCIAIGLAGFLRVLVLKSVTEYAFDLGRRLSNRAYEAYVDANFAIKQKCDSGEVINNLALKPDNLIYGVIVPSLTLVSSLIYAIFIVLLLAYVDYTITLGSILFFLVLYSMMLKKNKSRLIEVSNHISTVRDRLVKIVQNTIGAARDIVIDESSKMYVEEYSTENLKIRKAQADSIIIGTSPRYYVETIAMLIVAIFGYFIMKSENPRDYVSIVAVFALAAQKILPLAQQSYNSWATIKTNSDSAEAVLKMHKLPPEQISSADVVLNFSDSLELKGVKINLGQKCIVDNFNLKISRGQKIGIVGKSGSGKSTLIDYMMGLISGSAGNLLIDGQRVDDKNRSRWRKRISHVPQDVYIFNKSILYNIVLNDIVVDERLLSKAIEISQLTDLVSSLNQKLDSIIGDGGIMLSGGQRQRIGIARAIYKNSDVIFLDEATSALDVGTESLIMNALYSMVDKTIVIVAHRLNTLDKCDRIINVE